MELTGRVTKDATIKTLTDERQVVAFSIAVNDYVKKKGAAEGEQLTQYFNCSYWKSTGVSTKLLKGTLVEISGRMQTRAYAGADGEPKVAANFYCDSIKVHGLTTKTASTNEPKKEDEQTSKKEIENISAITEPAEDLPF